MIKICLNCKLSYKTYSSGRKFCSLVCYSSSEHKRENARRTNSARRLPNGTCRTCGTEIYHARVFCEGCKPSKKQGKCLNCTTVVQSKYDVKFCKTCRLAGHHRSSPFTNCATCTEPVPGYNRKYCDACWHSFSRSRRGRPRRVDANQSEIVDALIRFGCSVVDLSPLGGGAPDLLVGIAGNTYLMEVKNPKTRGKLNSRQVEWHNRWKGQVAVVHFPEEALGVVANAVH